MTETLLSPLEKAVLFIGLEAGELGQLASIATRRTVKAGERIHELGDEARQILIIESGTAALKLPLSLRGESKEITVDEKEAGAVLAWSALVPPHKLMFAVHAATDMQLVGFARDELEQLIADNDTLHIKLLTNLNRVIASRVGMLEAVLMRNLQRMVGES